MLLEKNTDAIFYGPLWHIPDLILRNLCKPFGDNRNVWDHDFSTATVIVCRNAGRDKPPPCCDVRTPHQSQPSHSWPARGSSINVCFDAPTKVASEHDTLTFHPLLQSPNEPKLARCDPNTEPCGDDTSTPINFTQRIVIGTRDIERPARNDKDTAAMWTRSCLPRRQSKSISDQCIGDVTSRLAPFG